MLMEVRGTMCECGQLTWTYTSRVYSFLDPTLYTGYFIKLGSAYIQGVKTVKVEMEVRPELVMCKCAYLPSKYKINSDDDNDDDNYSG
jgi:hypothetical protein